MKARIFLLFAFLAISIWGLGQATVSCFPQSADYNTGTTDGTEFTETSVIHTQSGGGPLGWARFDISEIPGGSTIQSVGLNLYIYEDNNAYWQVWSLEDDPLLGDAASVWLDGTDGNQYSYYWGDFPQPSWWITDLGSGAVLDLQDKIDDTIDWFGLSVWEFEGGEYWQISCHGWNEDNPPFITVTYLVPGAPLPAYNPYPLHNSFSVDVDVDLTWDFGDETETYDLYFDTEFPPLVKVVENETSGTSGTYDPAAIEYNTTYYWQVVSKNSAAELETPGPVWSFTTACDAWEMPIYEDFELVIPPSLPYCWTGIASSTTGFAFIQSIPWNGLNDGNCILLSNADDPYAEVILVSPKIEGGVTEKYVNFFGWGYTNLSVGTISDPAEPSTYSELTTVTMSSGYIDYQEFEVYYTSYSGTDEYIAFKLLNDDWYEEVYLDNILIDFAPTCPKPTDLSSSNPSTTSVDLDWIENGEASTWEIEYGYTGFTQTGEPMLSITEQPYTLEDLESGTEYDCYIRAYCSEDDQSYWSSKSTFSTQCEAFDVPIFEDFDNTTIPDMPLCWTSLIESTVTWTYMETIMWNSYSSPNCLWVYNSDDPDAQMILVSPMLEEPINELWINFFAFGWAPELIVGTVSDPYDASTFTEIGTVSLDIDWQEYDMFFNDYSGTDAYIAIKGGFSGWYEEFYLDNITIDHPPTCPKPTDPNTTNPNTNSADLNWLENGDATTWEIEYGYAGFTPTGVPTLSVTENPYTLEELESGTEYDWYVRAYCSEDDQSYWSSLASFTTLCDPFDVPLFEDFDDALIPEVPICWTPLIESTSQWSNIETVGWNPYSWPHSLYMYNNDDPEAEIILVSPMMDDPINELWINFFAFGWAPELIIGTVSDPLDASTFTEIETVSLQTDWQEYDVFFSAYTGSDVFIAIKGGFADWYQEIFLDDITIDHPPTCPKPTGVMTSSPATNSAVLSWSENGEASTWEIEYGYAGFTPTGIPTVSVSENPYTLDGLESGTEYDWYVRAYCSEDDQSYWSSLASFITLCEPFDVPVFEDFDNTSNPDVPVCWTPLVESTTQWSYIETVGWNAYSNPNSLIMYNSDDPDAEVILVSPMMLDPVNELWINLFAFGYAPELIIGTVSDPLDVSTFTEIGTITLGTSWQEYEVFFDDYAGSDVFIAIKGGYSDWYQEIYVDNITIDHPPTCPKPADLDAGGATTNSAILGWTENGDATTWNIEYGYAGFSPTGSGNAVANSNPYELTGLEDGTLYEYYIQADCGSGDLSYWVGPHAFQTLCFPVVLAEGEYYEYFEDITPPVIPPCIVLENTNEDDFLWVSSFDAPNSGISHLKIGYNWNSGIPMDDWFFSAPLEVLGGQTYNVVFYYTNSYEWSSEKLEVKFGTGPYADSMTSEPIFEDININYGAQNYQEVVTSFIPAESGIYFVGWHGFSSPYQDQLYVDDIMVEWDNSLVVSATANPDTICQGSETQLNGEGVGGSGNYVYSWTSDPAGFTSDEPNPIVAPTESTNYILEINDGFVSIYDTVYVHVVPLPTTPGTPSGITFFCASWGSATYSSSGAAGANWYDWVIDPVDAGTLVGSGTSVSIEWTEGWLGMATLSVIGMHDQCAGPESTGLNINVYLPDVQLPAFDTACLDWPAFELTGGTPAGGTYTGPGVDDDGWFDPMVAGIGTHVITYTYSDPAACENFAEAEIVVENCVGVDGIPENMKVIITPNPNSGKFTLQVKARSGKQVNVKVMNNYGEEVYTENDVELHSNYSTEVDLSAYAKGLYYLYIYSDEVNYVEKIIVK